MSEFRDPEREDRPSTSQFSDYSECQAKYRLQLAVPLPKQESEEATEGSKRHYAWFRLWQGSDQELKALDSEGQAVVEKAQGQWYSLVQEITEQVKSYPVGYPVGTGGTTEVREHRLWYPQKLYSGRLDAGVLFSDKERTFLIGDFKSLWGETEPPVLNWQLRGDVPLVKYAYGATRAVTAILQPNLKWMPPAYYDEKRVQQAETDSVALVRSIDQDEVLATPGEHCGRCSAILYCKAAQAMMANQGAITMRPTVGSGDNKAPSALIRSLPDRALERAYRYGKHAEKVTGAIHDELLERVLERPDDFGLYKDASSGDNPQFGDLQKVFNELVDLAGIERGTTEFDLFLSNYQQCMSLSLPKVTELLASVLGEESEERAREMIEKRLILQGLLKLVPKERKLILKKRKWELPE